MNRLTGITLSRPAGQDLACAVTYDALGRMTSKQAVTAVNGVAQVSAVFSQPVFNATKVHAVSSAQSMSDMFPTGTQNVTYTSFDKANKIKLGMDSICYTYGYDQQRIGMEEYLGSSVRTKQYVGSCEYITETGTSGTKTLTYLTGPYGVFAVVERQNNAETLHYILKDNLGSWTTITNGNGAVEQRLSFDAWGNQRNPNTWANYTANDTYSKPMLDRGFTGHEHLTAFGLINMNGRMYDPVMSSFLSADRYVQDPASAQGFNRYAYCMYNPLRFVDPTGWLSGSTGSGYPRTVSGLIQDYLSDPCYITRSQLREAGIYNIEGGYGYAGGTGTMTAYWMDGCGGSHSSSWGINTESGGFEVGAWAIPESFYSNWVNDCKGYWDYGGVFITDVGIGAGNKTRSYFPGRLDGDYWSVTSHYSVEKVGILPLDANNSRGYAASQLAHYSMEYNVIISNVFDNKKQSFSNSQVKISVIGLSSHTPIIDGDVFASAKASLYVDDVLINTQPLIIDQQIAVINPINVSYIGSASFIIPSSGKIILEIHGGWRVNTGIGWVVPSTTIFGPTINANKTIEINP